MTRRVIVRRLTTGLDPSELLDRLPAGGPVALLESARYHPVTGRYSLLAMEPFLVFRSTGDHVELRWRDRTEDLDANPLDVLRQLFRHYAIPPPRSTIPDPRLPFYGGAIGYFSYEARHLVEPGPRRARSVWNSPEIQLAFVDTAIVWDHVTGETWFVGYVHPEESVAEAEARLDQLEAHCQKKCQALFPAEGSPQKVPGTFSQELSQVDFEAMVQQAKEYIRRGEIYQANLSMRFRCGAVDLDPVLLYQALREINPSPFAGFLRFDDVTLVSSSPERLVRKRGQLVETRPIAGTRARSPDLATDAQLSEELFLSEKERAEHLMLVDLERNDLGRVCEMGSVQVNELMVEERYSHVRHIVSNVQGTLRPACDQLDLLRAMFPGGTITGVPKIRCMEVIDELEPVTRGIYTGSFGYFSFHGDLDLNIAIRTLVATEGQLWAQAGAGIVADSDPAREYQEILAKARALFEAVSMAGTSLMRNGRVSPLFAKVS